MKVSVKNKISCFINGHTYIPEHYDKDDKVLTSKCSECSKVKNTKFKK